MKRLTRSGVTKYYFHLFNDLMLYSEETVKGYKLHRKIELRYAVLTDKDHSDHEPHAIQINSPQKSFVVCCPDENEKVARIASCAPELKFCLTVGQVDGCDQEVHQ